MDSNSKDKSWVTIIKDNLHPRFLVHYNDSLSTKVDNLTLLTNSNNISNITLQIVFDPDESQNANLGLMVSLGVLLLILFLTIVYVVFRLKLKRNKEINKIINNKLGSNAFTVLEKIQEKNSKKIPIARYNSEGFSAKSKIDFDISSAKLINIQNKKKTAQEENDQIDLDRFHGLVLPKIVLQTIHKEAIQYVVGENIFHKKKNYKNLVKNDISNDKPAKKLTLKDIIDEQLRIKNIKQIRSEL